MPLYKLARKQLELIKENPFKLEKDIQVVVEANLNSLFDLQLITIEFPLGGRRIDTLAFDKDFMAFVVIEYKKGANFSVVDQGMSYLGLMLNNKAELILEYNDKCNGSLKKRMSIGLNPKCCSSPLPSQPSNSKPLTSKTCLSSFGRLADMQTIQSDLTSTNQHQPLQQSRPSLRKAKLSGQLVGKSRHTQRRAISR